MTTSPFEETLVGVVAAAAAAYLAWSVARTVASGRAHTRRGVLTREGDPGRLNVLIAFRSALALVSAVIAADLLLGLDLRSRL